MRNGFSTFLKINFVFYMKSKITYNKLVMTKQIKIFRYRHMCKYFPIQTYGREILLLIS